jgi:Mg/Co/Ni transporter MgtE
VNGTSRVFVARLAGLAVFDPLGDQVGKIRDVVATLRPDNRPPRVVGLVVEVQPRRRVFVPMTRVTSIDPGQVITTGLVNLRRFQQRPAETLVLGELLDRTVELLTDGDGEQVSEKVTVFDVAMEQQRTRDWLLAKVAVRKPGRGFRRRGETVIVDWEELSGFATIEEGQGAANLLAAFEQLKPADLAQVLHEMTQKRRIEVAAALDDEKLADVLEELPEDDQVEILGRLEAERAADVLEAMGPDDAADLLAELPGDQAETLLELMEPDEADPVRRLLGYDEDTAGGLMTSEPVVLPPDATVAEALALVRNPDLSPALASTVYVCRPPLETPTGRYLGTAHFQRLLREPPSSLVGGMIDTDPAPIAPDTPLTRITSYLATYNLVSAAVVDDADHLLGAVTVDDVLDHLLPDDWRERDVDDRPTDSVTGLLSDGDGRV